jgi:hypothetical protein
MTWKLGELVFEPAVLADRGKVEIALLSGSISDITMVQAG